MRRQLAYCTNVHAGSDLEGLQANLRDHSLAVKKQVAPDAPMGIGLWIAAPAATRLLEPARLADFAAWLAAQQLVPFTLNGFPYGNFHEAVVKHRVYRPTWFDAERLNYTSNLVEILHALLPEGVEGSISTLPLAWRSPQPSSEQLRSAARHLGQVAEQLERLEETTGRHIILCLEPEPGCYLQRCQDMIEFFGKYLCSGSQAEWRKRYLGVCHDICHSAVMFEDQESVLAAYAARGIRIGKVQVSSAVEVDFGQGGVERRGALQKALAAFAEDRYLHQTSVKWENDAKVKFFDDLPVALAAAEQDENLYQGVWRVHFHVPIFQDRFDLIGTTQQDIYRCLQASGMHEHLSHFEVETYAWGVLPPALQPAQLADGIAREMKWLAELL